jgi:hypothetical protein
MRGFWSEIFARTGRHFETPYRRVSFWSATLYPLVALIVTSYGYDWFPDKAPLWWTLGVLFAANLLIAFKKAVEDQYREQERIAVQRGDEIASLTLRVRDQEQQLTDLRRAGAGQRQLAAAQLTTLQAEGIDLTREMTRTFLPQRHPQRITDWQQRVEAVVARDAPAHLNNVRMLIPQHPNRRALESDKAQWEMAERLNRIQVVINALTN